MRPPRAFPPEETSLLIIDSVSSLFPSYFPNATELKSRLAQGKLTDKAQFQWLLNRKWNVASELATHLARLAARNIAVLAINQTHTKIKGQPRATLHPILAGGAWESTVQTRIVLYRDLPDARFAEVTKRAGRTVTVRVPELIVSFCIGAVCFVKILAGVVADWFRMDYVLLRRSWMLLHLRGFLIQRRAVRGRLRMRLLIARTRMRTKARRGGIKGWMRLCLLRTESG